MTRKLEEEEIARELNELKGWGREGDTIVKQYEFPNFRRAVEFVDSLANVVEELNHHPTITIDFDSVTITLTTRTHGGLTDRDFKAAYLFDGLLID